MEKEGNSKVVSGIKTLFLLTLAACIMAFNLMLFEEIR